MYKQTKAIVGVEICSRCENCIKVIEIKKLQLQANIYIVCFSKFLKNVSVNN